MNLTATHRTLAAAAALSLLAIATAKGQARDAELRNGKEVVASLLRSNAGKLIEYGFSARAELTLVVDDRGRVTGYGLSRPTGNRIVDAALVAVARQMVFAPATQDGRAVQTRVTIPLLLGDIKAGDTSPTTLVAQTSTATPER